MTKRSRMRVGLCIIAVALLWLVIGVLRPGASPKLDIRINTNGLPTVLGFPLGNALERFALVRARPRRRPPWICGVAGGIAMQPSGT